MNDKLYRGAKGLGTEIGHTSICYNGPQCVCGNRGCLETYLQTPALLRDMPYSSVSELFLHAEEPTVSSRIEQMADYLAAAIVNAINLYDLEKVLLWGELSAPPLLHALNARIESRVLNRSAVADPAVLAVDTPLSIRAGAMAALHAFFQERH